MLDFAAVYDKHHVVNGDAGLRNIGGDHYLPHSLRWTIENLEGKGVIIIYLPSFIRPDVCLDKAQTFGLLMDWLFGYFVIL